MPTAKPTAVEGQIVIAAYRPKSGKAADLEIILRRHVPTLRSAGLVTERPVTLLKSFTDGTYLEIFEWVSGEAAEKAHDTPAVAAVWEAIGAIADFVPLSALPESARPFPHFAPVDAVVR